jgi:hypothetical protein
MRSRSGGRVHRFVVGTGRCGSTLLSRMLRSNPDVLELSEFYAGLDWNRRFQPEPMSGHDFFELLSTPQPFISMAMERGHHPAEVSYPFARPGARYGPRDALPWILAAALPPLAEDPDALFDELRAFVRDMPARPPAAHALALFDALAKRLGRSVWVERSAASTLWIADLDRAFPGARFLHLHRRGEETALSMREHAVFRLAVMLTYQLPLGRNTGELTALGSDADHVAQLLASRPEPHHFGAFWNAQVTAGCHALRALDPDRHHAVRFEDLQARPEAVLEEIARFLDLPNPSGSWRRDAARLLEGATPLRLPALPEHERAALAAACEEGNRLLGRA